MLDFVTKKTLAALALLLLLAACEDTPAEPAGSPRATSIAAKELTWQVPPTWTLAKAAERGTYRAKYTIPHQGDAKTSAEMLVKRIGGSGHTSGAKAALDAFLEEWEGPGVEEAKRRSAQHGGHDVRIVEIEATYKMGMGPKRKGRTMASVIKKDWAGIAAAVVTEDRGTWLFRLVGPRDAVKGARSSFFNVLDGAK